MATDPAKTTEDIIAAPAGSQETEGVTGPTSDPVAALVGEGKKFKDIAALAAGKLESDRFIEQVQRENADLREKLLAASEKAATQHTLTEVLEALNKRPSGNSEDSDAGTAPKTVSLEDITRLVKATTAAERAAEVATANRMSVNKRLLEVAGGDAKVAREILAARTTELGLSADQVRDMSEKSPAALVELIVGKAPNGTPNTRLPNSKVNTEALNGTNHSGERKLSYYNAKRREMGITKFYNDAALQAQRKADMVKYGDSFVDTIN
jgi:hypothetical protein